MKRLRRILFNALTAISLLLAIATAVAERDPPAVLQWDLRVEQTTNAVNWPSEVVDSLWFIEEPATVSIRLPGDEAVELSFRSAILSRDQEHLRSVYLFFTPEDANAAVRRASDFCDQFQIEGKHLLEPWAANPRQDLGDARGRLHVRVARPRNAVQPCVVEIRPTFNKDAPWQVRVAFTFGNVGGGPTTRP